ncbi:MAG: hypothetical protein J2P13_08300 [Acidobacteria bacterium]|nr:hypothetical protein [Acidobacteriota bacterium]
MKHKNIAVFTVVMLAAVSAAAQSAGQKSFDAMKSLTGEWEGKNQMGDPVEISYRLTAGGSALMSEIRSSTERKAEDMISMIHMDGERLLLTHYCHAGNQPRMQASISPDGKTVTFDFVDATNLRDSQPGHMQRVIFTFTDRSHHTEEWHFQTAGKEMVEKFELEKRS